MRVKPFLAIAFCCMIISSCQKDLTFENSGGPGGGGSTNGDLLAKVVTKQGADSAVEEFEYNASKKLVRTKTTDLSAGNLLTEDIRIVRNSGGIITSIIQKSDALTSQGIDSVIVRVHYNTATQRYTSKVSEISLFGLSITDSTVLVYDAGGKVIREEDYFINALFGSQPLLAAKTEYTTGTSGISQINIFFVSDLLAGGPPELLARVKYSYDGKTSPLILPAGEASIILRADLSATENANKLDYEDVQNAGAGNFIETIAYTYNTKNKPSSAIGTENPGGITTTISYTYK